MTTVLNNSLENEWSRVQSLNVRDLTLGHCKKYKYVKSDALLSSSSINLINFFLFIYLLHHINSRKFPIKPYDICKRLKY